MAYRSDPEFLNVAEAIEQLNLDVLRPLGQWVSREAPSRKQDLVPYLTQMLARADVVRRLYESLDKISKEAVQEALANPTGRMEPDRFQAKYGQLPGRGERKSPARLQLFMPHNWTLPPDLRPILKTFVPEPRSVSISTSENLPTTVPMQIPSWRSSRGEKPEEIPLRQRDTAPAALKEIPAMLRLLEAGKMRVGEKTRKPGQATIDAVTPLLVNGDFYQVEDKSKYQHDPGSGPGNPGICVAVYPPGGGIDIALGGETGPLSRRAQGDGAAGPRRDPQCVGQVGRYQVVRRI